VAKKKAVKKAKKTKEPEIKDLSTNIPPELTEIVQQIYSFTLSTGVGVSGVILGLDLYTLFKKTGCDTILGKKVCRSLIQGKQEVF